MASMSKRMREIIAREHGDYLDETDEELEARLDRLSRSRDLAHNLNKLEV